MRKSIYISLILLIIVALGPQQDLFGRAFKFIRVGSVQNRIVDSGDQGESASGQWMWYYQDDFYRQNLQQNAWYIIHRDWTDADGKTWQYKQSGIGGGSVDEVKNTIPVPDEDGITIRRYLRHEPPSVVVDGYNLEEPFPLEGDEVNPDKIPGTADVMVESHIRTCSGIDIEQKVLAWSQKNHDDYILYEWTFTNTGNIDLDDEIELPDQTITDLHLWRNNRFGPAGIGRRHKNWYSKYGEHQGDSLRISYGYSARRASSTFDDMGDPTPGLGFLRNPDFLGEATLHVDRAPDDPSDWEIQPSVTAQGNCDWRWVNLVWDGMTEEQVATQWQVFTQGLEQFDGTPDQEDAFPGTHHCERMDEKGLKWVKDNYYYSWHPWTGRSSGPWTLEFGESVRVVYALVMGSISPEKSWEVGRAWQKGNAPNTWDGAFRLPPQYTVHPDLADNDNDRAKDSWVYTGKDSLFKNANAAQWNVQNNYNIPVPPPAPAIEITSLPDMIKIEWDGEDSESVEDFAGYRVYRAVGNPGPVVQEDTLLGVWEPVFECGEGTEHPEIVHSYDDDSAERGKGYFYYVAAFDKGVDNQPDVYESGESLESGRYLNRTTEAAHLTRAPGNTLSEIRVVPNPYNISAKNLQYIGEPDKIMFLNLPPECTITIYTERGDLVKTLNHADGSGDEAWGTLREEHLSTETGQMIVSGVYIAHIETPNGEISNVKFVIVR